MSSHAIDECRPPLVGWDIEAECRAVAEALEDATAVQILTWAFDRFGSEGMVIACSMADTVLPQIALGIRPEATVLFVDTGYHFVETIRTAQAMRARYAANLLVVQPERTVAEQDDDLGPALHSRDPDRCCSLRKVAPFEQALSGFTAWATGLRREESPQRRRTPVVAWDGSRRKVKVSPLARWTKEDVEAYCREHDTVVNPLVAQGFPSIGCAPCTRAVAPGEDLRAGRWSGFAKTECGLHRPAADIDLT